MRNTLMIVMLMLIGGLAAQPGGFGRGMGWNDELNLTSDQIKQIEAYRADFRKQQIDLRVGERRGRFV